MASSVKLVLGNTCVSQPHNLPYKEFTRRISAAERLKVERILDGLDPAKLFHFVTYMHEPRNAAQMQEILCQEQAPHYALRALRDGSLSVGAVATICHLHAALGHKGAKLFFALENPTHAKMMISTSGAYSREIRGIEHHHLEIPEEDVEHFFQVVAQESAPIDLFYVVFPDDQPIPEEVNGVVVQAPTISQCIHQVGMSIFGISDAFAGGPVRIAASFGMLLTGVATLTPYFCMPNPVLGPSTLEDIRLGQEKGGRDMAIPFPGVTLPPAADGYVADDISFTYHDFFHVATVSHIPNDHRTRFMAISRSFETAGASMERVETFADLDFSVYRRFETSDEEKFWRAALDGVVVTYEKAKLAPKTALEIIRAHASDKLLKKLPQMRDHLERVKARAELVESSGRIAAVLNALLELIQI